MTKEVFSNTDVLPKSPSETKKVVPVSIKFDQPLVDGNENHTIEEP